MSFVDVHTSNQRKRVDQFYDTSESQTGLQKKDTKGNDKPNLVSIFPLPWTSGHTEYLIISDSDASDFDEDDQPEVNKNEKRDDNSTKELPTLNTCQATSNTVKNESSFRDRISNVTKDIGNFFTNPSANIREYLRRREGYMPPEKRLIQEQSTNED